MSLVGLLIGLMVAIFGFSAMRNPMRFAVAPMTAGYFQRLVLDSFGRNGLRFLGALICLFGAGIATDCLAALTHSTVLELVNQMLWGLLGLSFLCGCCTGLMLSIWFHLRGDEVDWLRVWRGEVQLGPVDVTPNETPKVQKEVWVWTLACGSIFLIVVLAALFLTADKWL